MENGSYAFTKRIIIEGMMFPVSFIFRMLNGDKKQYKIRTSNPVCDFNISAINKNSIFQYEDENTIPQWLRNDKNTETKLSEAIANTC